MDLMKERMIAISPRYNERTRQIGMQLVANVHDEVLSQVPLEYLRDAEAQDYVCDMMETPSIELKVPIKVGLGISEHSWAEAAGDPVMYDSGLAGKIR